MYGSSRSCVCVGCLLDSEPVAVPFGVGMGMEMFDEYILGTAEWACNMVVLAMVMVLDMV